MSINFDVHYLKSLIDKLKAEYPELNDDDDLRGDVFEGETDLHNVLEKLVSSALEADAWAGAIKARREELSLRQKRFSDKNESMRALILSILEHADLPKVQLIEATLSMRHMAPAPIVTDVNLLPENCVKIERKADMAAIKNALESIPSIDGVVISNGKSSLTIRTK